jgi:hypothetical protein
MFQRLKNLLLILFFIFICNSAYTQISITDLEHGIYTSKCFPGERMFINSEAGRNWWVASIRWERGPINKNYTLLHNQSSTNICDEEVSDDFPTRSDIIRIKKSRKILLVVTSRKSFKTSDGCEWFYYGSL